MTANERLLALRNWAEDNAKNCIFPFWTSDFIVDHEHSPRQYYSGYLGPINYPQSTHLYVSLRCMQIERSRYLLYAGGGLLRESSEEKEWQETEAKLATMRSLLTP